MKRNLTKPHRSAAFTLIELLVVIGVIALLFGILLPVLSAARRAANQVHCSTQIAQVSKALEMHANEHKERYPTAGGRTDWDETDPQTGLPSWMQQIETYLDNKDVFSACHEYPLETDYHYFLGTRAVSLEAADKGEPFEYAPVIRSKVRQTSVHVLGGDNNWRFENEPDADKDDYTQETLKFEEDADHWEPQHGGGLNIMFADGHVALFTAYEPDAMTFHYARMTDWWGF